jgi:hypothetical protein
VAAAIVGAVLMVSGLVVAFLADPLGDTQLIAMGLVALGFVVWLMIPIVREIFTASIGRPTSDTDLHSPSITTVLRQR